MSRTVLGVLIVLLIGAGGLRADELTGKVKKIDPEKHTVTVTVERKDMTFNLVDAKVFTLAGQGKNAIYQEAPEGIKALKPGADVSILRENKDGKETVTEVKVIEVTAKKKKKNKQ